MMVPCLIVKNFLRGRFFYGLLVLLILALALVISLNNLAVYNTWWADDGGAHLGYIRTIAQENRLPSMTENYLAWHEPIFYYLAAGWTILGQGFGVNHINWQDAFNILIFYFFLFLVWQLTYVYTARNRWLALLALLIFSFLFTAVKLAAYVNNELLVQAMILLCVLLFYQLKLASAARIIPVFFWSLLLGLAALVKLTAVVVLLVAIIFWLVRAGRSRKWDYVYYALISLTVVLIVNLPWLAYKQQAFGSAFSINLFEHEKRQEILTSSGWQYLTKVNFHIFYDDPYWQSPPPAFASTYFADTFGDYYNLFNNVDRLNALPLTEKIKTDNGRFTTEKLKWRQIWVYRLAAVIMLIWLLGLLGQGFNLVRRKNPDPYAWFLLLLIFGGYAALVYNNLRYPYLARGVLKSAFILFTLPPLVLLANDFWWRIFKNKYLWLIICVLPPLAYALLVWPIIMVK